MAVSGRAPPLPPRFQALKRIGSGGMGVVYEAMDVERGARVALKTVIHNDADALARFKHEFRALQGIHHPNLVELGELIGDADEVFFTMELVEGVDLLTWARGARGVRKRELTPESATVVDLVKGARDRSSGARAGSSDIHTPDTFVDGDDLPTGSAGGATPPSGPATGALVAATFDEARVRDSFRQIALGLNALHEARRVHRDVKPSNVLVTPEGRAVLLDFGLVFDSGSHDRSVELAVVGTPAYMAPEQASSQPVGPPADWYSAGVMLYQCLTGRLPFEGAALAVLMAKQYKEPPSPSRVVSGVAPDLEALCVDLLKFEPGARPTGREVLRRLNVMGPDASGPISVVSGSQAGSAPFVGRARELAELGRGLGDATGRAVTVALYGESGVGKRCLVRRFLEKSLDDFPDALVLTGRCYEREAVPYKAFDEVIDTLSRKLARLEKEAVLPLVPPGIASAAQLFPALCRVPGVAPAGDFPPGARGRSPADLDPHERRRAAFHALRALFGLIAKTRRVVILIDDLQWTDADSLALLVDLLQPPETPPILLVVTLRTLTSPGGEPELPTLLGALPGDVRAVKVGRLAPADARQLAASLLKLRVSPSLVGGAEMIATEAAGHPLFIDELVRHAALSSHPDAIADAEPVSVAPRLDDVLWARILRLERPQRRVLDVACVIGAPMAQELVAQAAGLDMRDFVRAASLLRTSNLVRTGGARATDAIEPYHDRVREAVFARLTEDERSHCHERIASALEASKAYDPEVLAVHWAGAGQPSKASRYMVVAAEQAALALAFQRAARLYQRAIDLAPEDDARRRPLRRRLGEALANTGQGPLAAAEYERAAVGAGAAEALDLRRRAAEQLLRSGKHEEGLVATRAVLAAVGLSLPRTRSGAIFTLLFYRFVLTLRGLRFTPRDESDLAPSELARLDVCWSVSFTLPYADLLRGAVFQTLHVLLALRAGESVRVARALATEVGYLGTRGPSAWPRTERAIARAEEAAERTGQPYARATALVCSGIAHCMNLRFAGAIERLSTAIEIFRERCPGSAWEVTTSQFFHFVALYYACRLGPLRELHEVALKDAIERGDHYGAVMLRIGVLNRIWWLGGDSARARRELEEARRAWPSSEDGIGYHVIHFHLAVAECYVDLFDGEWERAHAHARAQGPALRSSLLLHAEALRLEWLGLSLRTALAAAAALDDARPAERDALLREADGYIRSYGPLIDHPLHRPMLLSARASMAATRGQLDAARRLIERMVEAPDSEEGWTARECARWILGRLRGGIEGEAQVRAAEAELMTRGVGPGPRAPLVLFPGLARYI